MEHLGIVRVIWSRTYSIFFNFVKSYKLSREGKKDELKEESHDTNNAISSSFPQVRGHITLAKGNKVFIIFEWWENYIIQIRVLHLKELAFSAVSIL